ncbi:MAG TPA: hypothetical protein VKL22_04760 [Actinomycetota bacterium]|nr:hypothetical protein [Actinomycetota bacterium]
MLGRPPVPGDVPGLAVPAPPGEAPGDVGTVVGWIGRPGRTPGALGTPGPGTPGPGTPGVEVPVPPTEGEG